MLIVLDVLESIKTDRASQVTCSTINSPTIKILYTVIFLLCMLLYPFIETIILLQGCTSRFFLQPLLIIYNFSRWFNISKINFVCMLVKKQQLNKYPFWKNQ